MLGFSPLAEYPVSTIPAAAAPPAEQTITVTGIGSEEAFGTATISAVIPPQDITATGIATAEAFGAVTIFADVFITVTAGIATEEAFGTAVLTAFLPVQTISPPSFVTSSLMLNLVSWWPLDEASGTASDAHGSNHLTDVNGVLSAAGRVVTARDFETTSSQRLSVASNADLVTGDTSWTFACWVKAESFVANAVIACKGTNPGDTIEWELGLSSGGKYLFGTIYYGSPTSIVQIVGNANEVVLGQWCFVVLSHDAENNLFRLRVNNGTAKTLAHSNGCHSTTSPFTLGARNNFGFYDGLVDEAAFWKRVLTPEEETRLFNSNNGMGYTAASGDVFGTPTMLVDLNQSLSLTGIGSAENFGFTQLNPDPLLVDLFAYWRMDEASGVAIDSHRDYDLPQIGTVGAATGIRNGCRTFTGTQAFVYDDPAFQTGGTDFALSLHVKLSAKSANQVIVSRHSGDDPARREFRLYWSLADDCFVFEVWTGTGLGGFVKATHVSPITIGTWYHVYIQYTSSTRTLGISTNNNTLLTAVSDTDVVNTGVQFMIGGHEMAESVLDLPLFGAVDEVGFWRRTLTTGERTRMFGAPDYPFAAQMIVATGVATAEAFGTASLMIQTLILPGGVPSAEVFGTAQLNLTMYATGIVTAEAFGATKLTLNIGPTGIATAEAFGTARLNLSLVATGIVTAEAFGTARLNLSLVVTGIATAEAFGTHLVAIIQVISPAGIASTEAFGAVTIFANQFITVTGIATEEAFGTTRLTALLGVTGIASAEAFGTTKLTLTMYATGIASAESFGTLHFDQTMYAPGIASGEAFGAVILTLVTIIAPAGIAPDEAFGTAQLNLNIKPPSTLSVPGSLADGMMAWWAFEDTDPSAAIDSHGTSHLAPWMAAPSVDGSGKIGNCRDFELDSGQSLWCISNDDLVTGDIDFTFAGWVKQESFPADAVIAAKGYTIPTHEWRLWYDGAEDRIKFSVTDSGGVTTTVTDAYAVTGDWALVICSHDSVNNILRIRTRNLDPTTLSYSGGVRASSGHFFIGSQSSLNYWDGKIDQAAFWKRVLTPTEEEFLFNSNSGRTHAEAMASVQFGTPALVVSVGISPAGIASTEAFGIAKLNLSLFPTGIVTAEVFGAHTIFADVFITVTGIATAEAFGAVSLSMPIAPLGIASAEAFGTLTIYTSQFITATGIASGQAFGTPNLTLILSPSGIATGEAFGATKLPVFLFPTGIATEEALGSVTIFSDLSFSVPGIPSAEAFGSASVYVTTGIFAPSIVSAEVFGLTELVMQVQPIYPAGIGSAEAFGQTSVSPYLRPIGIVSGEAFGTARTVISLKPTGIVPAEAFGTARTVISLKPTSIGSLETFGGATIFADQFLRPTGVTSSETFGSVLVLAASDISAPSIESAEAFGTVVIKFEGLVAVGIATEEAFGTPGLSFTIAPAGILSTEAFGQTKIGTPQLIVAVGIPTGEAVGSVTWRLAIAVAGIGTEEAFGDVALQYGLMVTGIPSEEAFGTVAFRFRLGVLGIPSEEAFGSTSLQIQIAAIGIASAEAFGTLSFGRYVLAVGIVSEEAFGTAKLRIQIAVLGIPSTEAFGSTSLGLQIVAVGIGTREAFGTPSLRTTILALGIASGEAFGTATLGYQITAFSIPSQEAVGTPRLGLLIAPLGLPSDEVFGVVTLISDQMITPEGLISAEAFGVTTVGLYEIASLGIFVAPVYEPEFQSMF